MIARRRWGIVAALVSVTSMGIGGSPATGADTKGTIAIVNGIPGKTVDVCINGKELKSKLRYGKSITRARMGTGKKRIKFFRADPRRCKGIVLAKKTVQLGPGTDLTIVATKRSPMKVVVFDNEFDGEIPPDGVPFEFVGILLYRHAADFTVNFHLRTWDDNPEFPWSPAPAPLWSKGDNGKIPEHHDEIWQVRATLPEATRTIASKRVLIVRSHRYEHILVGTKAKNARFVFIDRRVSQPT